MTTFPSITVNDVWVQYRLRNARHYNLKRTVANAASRRREPPEVLTALAGVSFQVTMGDRVALTGPNGSGKSTLLAVLAGTLQPSSGTASTLGRVVALLGGPGEGLDPEQTGRENAISLGVRHGESPKVMEGIVDEIADFSGLGNRFDHPVYTYSSGMQARLRFSAITCLTPGTLIVDEGIGVADEEFNERAAARLEEFFNRAGTLVLASHNTAMLQRYCRTRLALRDGVIESYGKLN